MPLSALTVLGLAAQCAPTVAPDTLLSVAEVESGLDPLVIGVNGPNHGRIASRSREEATAKAAALIAAGRNIDLGLAQINSRNLRTLGLTVEAAFDPCRNLTAGGQVLQSAYLRSAADTVGAQAALRTALSYYNTGRPDRGFHNGYVARVVAAAGRVVPSLTEAPSKSPPLPVQAERMTPAWDVFGASRSSASFVFNPPQRGDLP